jgi:Ran GTPase-activating protein (RanGAP) involved in mRNA processing and transport
MVDKAFLRYCCERLKCVFISGNEIGDEGAKAIAEKLPALKSIEILDLRSISLSMLTTSASHASSPPL